jgi:Tannase and feruloyl esterase
VRRFLRHPFADAPNLGLARGYASATGNGGHESALGFDGVWAANAPELQEDFGWRSNHVVTLITKAITTQCYGSPIKYSYMVGNSKGGQAVLLEAQRFPEDLAILAIVTSRGPCVCSRNSRRKWRRRPFQRFRPEKSTTVPCQHPICFSVFISNVTVNRHLHTAVLGKLRRENDAF